MNYDPKTEFRLKVTPHWNAESETLTFDTEGICGKIYRDICSFKDRVVRQKLIELGWTPPANTTQDTLATS